MITLELTEEEIGTLIDALGTWMELPEECEGEEWLRRQALGADLDMDLREAWARKDDGWDAAINTAAAAEDTFIQAGIDAREQVKATSRAQTRREEQAARMMKGTVTPVVNDPVDW